MPSDDKTPLRYAFVFVCQRGVLELQSMLLVASLQRFLRCDHELLAAVPTPAERWGEPGPATLAFFARLGVRVCPIENRFGPAYAIGNKLACLAVPTTADKLVFLDSDILSTRDFHHEERFRTAVNVKPADQLTFTHDPAVWQRVYAHAGLAVPAERMRATVSGEETPPYFNSGVIAIRPNPDFSRTWLALCQAIDADEEISNKRPWLDQVTLPAVLAQLGLPYDCLDETYNFPAHLRPLDPERLPIFCHYHSLDVLAREPVLRALVTELARAHPEIHARLRATGGWRVLLTPGAMPQQGNLVRRARRAATNLASRALLPVLDRACRVGRSAVERRNNVILTGIPRSGTSLYQALLTKIENVVCLNEIFPTPHLYWLYRRLRSQVRRGRPIPNKFTGTGEVATNTIERDTQILKRVVPVRDANFVLAQKYTLPYLNRLPELVAAGWQIWLLVRHPAFAISSWKRCPPNFPVANLLPPHPLLAAVRFTSTDLEQRRIDVWNHYARLIHSCRSGIHLVRYEDLVEDVHAELGRFCSAHGLTLPPELAPLSSRNKPGQYVGMDDAFVRRVLAGCELSLFGYNS